MKPERKSKTGLQSEYDLVIVGGGIHGITLLRLLTATRIVRPERIVIIDPHDRLIANWLRTTEITGMTHLRSPSSHNVDVSFHSLRRFAKLQGYQADHFIRPYHRPSLALFNAHASYVCSHYDLDARHIRGTVERLDPKSGYVDVITEVGRTSAKNIILAVGSEHEVNVPTVFGDLYKTGATSPHVFDDSFDIRERASSLRPLVIGGGITAVQIALRLSGQGKQVQIVSPHPVRVAQFDGDPCYIGPACLRDFDALTNPDVKLQSLMNARNPGSLPEELADSLSRAMREHEIDYLVGDMRKVNVESKNTFDITLVRDDKNTTTIRGDSLTLATGFPGIPGKNGLIHSTGKELGLPVDSDGRPLPDRALRWHPRIFVTGRAGELVIGPSASNIIGAHLAARRIVPFLKNGDVDSIVPWRPI